MMMMKQLKSYSCNRAFPETWIQVALSSYLIVGAEIFSIGGEGQQSIGSVHQTANLQAIVVTTLPWTGALSCPHHITVATLDASI